MYDSRDSKAVHGWTETYIMETEAHDDFSGQFGVEALRA